MSLREQCLLKYNNGFYVSKTRLMYKKIDHLFFKASLNIQIMIGQKAAFFINFKRRTVLSLPM